jgi:hypothetical protein
MLTAATTKKTIGNTDDCQIYNFGQQCLNNAADWSAAEGGQILSHFQHIVSGVSMPLCLIAAVFKLLSVGGSVGWSEIRVAGL